MSRWIIGVIAVLGIGIASLVIISAYTRSAHVSIAARPSYGSISLHGDERVGQITEVDVHVDWHEAAASTSVRLDGIAGWKTTRFGPDGYESRAFCDDDNVPEATRLRSGSVVWGTGSLWPGASCDIRLFLIPTGPGTYTIRAHFLAAPKGSALDTRTVERVDAVLPVTVAPRWVE